ncbi:hypothetical protein [Nitrospirillum viridazoti]|uniref:Uncharacterized protein n=1 Tax=Nitrospirillum amazonense TaxID=28077 RepID=A0A560HZR6_9PROT|nr:hypothetical protein [Nitrospirillum amazonense]TWB51079.1 hypothetical protein FBZ92_12131 [Nitrospirillum amazonense]
MTLVSRRRALSLLPLGAAAPLALSAHAGRWRMLATTTPEVERLQPV